MAGELKVAPVCRRRYRKPDGSFGFRLEKCVAEVPFRGKTSVQWKWGVIDASGKVLSVHDSRTFAKMEATGKSFTDCLMD